MDTELNNNISVYGKFLPTFDVRSLKTAPNATAVFKRNNPQIDIFDSKALKDEDNFSLDIEKLSRYLVF